MAQAIGNLQESKELGRSQFWPQHRIHLARQQSDLGQVERLAVRRAIAFVLRQVGAERYKGEVGRSFAPVENTQIGFKVKNV